MKGLERRSVSPSSKVDVDDSLLTIDYGCRATSFAREMTAPDRGLAQNLAEDDREVQAASRRLK